MAIPVTADRFLAALRAEGLTVNETPGWKTRNRNHVGAWGPLHGVLVHHTAGHESGSTGIMMNGITGLPGPLCQGLIHKNGEVDTIGWGRANHAGGGDSDVLAAVKAETWPVPRTNEHQGSPGVVDGNPHFVGYECVNLGDGQDPWPSIQLEAIARACAAVCRIYGWSVNSVIRHMDWSDWKPDPKGFDWNRMRSRITTILAGRPNAIPMSAFAWEGAPVQEEDTMEPIDVWHYTGADTERDAYWYLRDTQALASKILGGVNTTNATLAATKAVLATLDKKVSQLDVKVDALAVKVDSLVTTGLTEAQVTAIAEAVVNELHARTAE